MQINLVFNKKVNNYLFENLLSYSLNGYANSNFIKNSNDQKLVVCY